MALFGNKEEIHDATVEWSAINRTIRQAVEVLTEEKVDQRIIDRVNDLRVKNWHYD